MSRLTSYHKLGIAVAALRTIAGDPVMDEEGAELSAACKLARKTLAQLNVSMEAPISVAKREQ